MRKEKKLFITALAILTLLGTSKTASAANGYTDFIILGIHQLEYTAQLIVIIVIAITLPFINVQPVKAWVWADITI